MVGPLRGGEAGIKNYQAKPYETQEKRIQEYCALFSVLVYIDQQKKVIHKVSENIIFSNLNLTEIFVMNFLSISISRR